MAKLEVELSQDVKERLDTLLSRTGQQPEDFVAELITSRLAPTQSSDPNLLPFDEWLRVFQESLANMPKTQGHLSNDDLRRVNMYED
jgi:hypothetical protein